MMSDRDHSRSPRGQHGVSLDEIMRLVVQREQARFSKDFSLADSYRDQLGGLGVTLQDKEHTWRSNDGRQGRIPSFNEIENAGGSPDAVMSMMQERMQPPPVNDDSENGFIKNLIRQREEARAAKDYARSDQIRDELKSQGVDIFDKDKIWKGPNGACGVVIGFNAGNGSHPCPSDKEITILVQQREKAREAKDWAMGDMIRSELKLWSVEIFDKDKTWRASDGRTGQVPPWSTDIQAGAILPTAGFQPGAQAVNQAYLNQLIAACVANANNPVTSARTMSLLQQAASPMGAAPQPHYGAPVVPQRAAPPPPAPRANFSSRSGGDMNGAIQFCKEANTTNRYVADSEIQWLMEVREKLRHAKDYSGADKLRDAYKSNLGLELLEKEKAWNMTDGRRGNIPSFQQLGL